MTAKREALATGLAVAWALAAGSAGAQSPRAGAPLPELPASGADGQTVSSLPVQVLDITNNSTVRAPAPQLTPRELYEHVRRGVVVIEHNGAPSAIGTVLGGDGRILTALSGLGGAEGADVRYADGTGVHAKLVYSDKALDLALLSPDAPGGSGAVRRTEGLSASEVDPAGTEIRAMLPARGVHLGPAVAALKGQADVHAPGGGPLLRMLDVDVQGAPVVGAPLLDPTGDVVAVLVRACRGPASDDTGAPPPGGGGGAGSWPPPATPSPAARRSDGSCQPVVVGAPVSAVRSFLAHATSVTASAPWLGIRGEPERAGGVRGVRVVDVAAASPAEKAGLKAAADVIVAVDGRPIDGPDMLGEAIGKHTIGDSVKLLVFGGGKFRELAVVLRSAP